MESAFGIDHGYVEKAFAFRAPKIPKNPAKAFKSGQKLGGKAKAVTGMVGQAAGGAVGAAGAKAGHVGGAMQAHPFKTGAAIIGGSSVGLTGGVYSQMKPKLGGGQPPKPTMPKKPKTPGAPSGGP